MGTWGETSGGAERSGPAPGTGLLTERRATRPVEGRVWKGVCAGLADHFGVDARPLRVATVIAFAALGWPVLVAYLVVRCVMPSGRDVRADGTIRRTKRVTRPEFTRPSALPRVAGWAMVAAGAWLLFDRIFDVTPGLLLAVACVALGANLAFRNRD